MISSIVYVYLIIYFLSIVCSVGTYSDDINDQCELCPANSEANVTGLSVCPCIQNYYRATDEEASVPYTSKWLLLTYIMYAKIICHDQ